MIHHDPRAEKRIEKMVWVGDGLNRKTYLSPAPIGKGE